MRRCLKCGVELLAGDFYASRPARCKPCHRAPIYARKRLRAEPKVARPEAMERFEAQYEPLPLIGCWIWTGTLSGGGHRLPYGRFWINGRNEAAHRAAWMLFVGEIPQGMFACHKCDQPMCVNPAHLFLGTARENTADMITKGRKWTAPGEQNNNAKLTSDDVLAIRADDGYQRDIAARYGVSQASVSLIKRRKNWAHLGPSHG